MQLPDQTLARSLHRAPSVGVPPRPGHRDPTRWSRYVARPPSCRYSVAPLRLATRVVKNIHDFDLHDVAVPARSPSSFTARPRRDFPQSWRPFGAGVLLPPRRSASRASQSEFTHPTVSGCRVTTQHDANVTLGAQQKSFSGLLQKNSSAGDRRRRHPLAFGGSRTAALASGEATKLSGFRARTAAAARFHALPHRHIVDIHGNGNSHRRRHHQHRLRSTWNQQGEEAAGRPLVLQWIDRMW